MGNFDLPKERINAFQLADRVGRRAKAFAANRKTVVKAEDDIKEGFKKRMKEALPGGKEKEM